jgi:hypothetical protein
MGEKWPIKFSLTITTSTEIVRDFLHAAKLRHGTDGFTSPPKEGALRIFSPEKSDGFGRVYYDSSVLACLQLVWQFYLFYLYYPVT